MNKEEFIGKLQMCYFGERNAFDEIVQEFDRLNNIINELEKWLEEQKDFLKEISFIQTLNEIQMEHKIMINDYQNVLDKLKELKEGKE